MRESRCAAVASGCGAAVWGDAVNARKQGVAHGGVQCPVSWVSRRREGWQTMTMYCSACGVDKRYPRAFYWHLRAEHGWRHREAFDAVGNELDDGFAGGASSEELSSELADARRVNGGK